MRRRALPCWLLLLLMLCVPPTVLAQSFSAINGRNHPELDWQVAETEHFRIMYPQRLAGIEAEAAAIAEASYAALAENLGVTFDEKIRIYLSDEDEITNGFAVPLGTGYTEIWVETNEWASVWTGREKWLRKVIAHELAHIFHYRAVQARPRILNFILGDPLPRFWTEGLAQYETEAWDAQRGDRWLRTAVLDDALDYDDGRSAWNGRLLYASGNAQLRYFANRYGDSTLVRLLAHRKPVLGGLARVHDFGAAFEAVVGEPYREFYDDWRRHVNIYYNTLASQLHPVDSLHADPLRLPGRYLYDVQASPDTAKTAVLSLTSLARPIRRLYVVDRALDRTEIGAEGAINTPVAWSPDGETLAYARTTRGRYGSLLNDLYLVGADGRGRRRLTESRRAASPTFAPDGRRLAFIAAERGTANVFVLDLDTGDETRVTDFAGDVQLAGLRWHPSEEKLAAARIGADGRRDLVVLDLAAGTVEAVTDGRHDDRMPVWSPDGQSLAYTSLRDAVPNVFVLDLGAGTHRRVTRLATGATAHDWTPPDSAHALGALALVANVSKQRDRAFRVDAARTAPGGAAAVPAPYAAWTRHRPPREVPPAPVPDAALIQNRYAYSSWRNLTHVISGAAPYVNDTDDYGVAGGTMWIEPLGKHLLVLGAGYSVPAPRAKSFGFVSYVNNQLRPTLSVYAYRIPEATRLYEDGVLSEDFAGADLRADWPLDWTDRPFVAERLGLRLRYLRAEPLDLDELDPLDTLPFPEAGSQAEVRLSFTRKTQRPYRFNPIHPLDGHGLRLRVKAAAPVLGADTRFVRGDLKAFAVLPALGLHRLYLYGRLQAQAGDPLPQDYIGFPRLDEIQVDLPSFLPLTVGDTDRVRGYRRFAVGDRVLFGTAEYRLLLVPDLQTRVLGLVSFGAASLALFADGGLVWRAGDYDEATRRLGVGAEIKNQVSVLGLFSFGHALGLAQPADRLGDDDDYDLYYRLRAAVPF